MYRLCSQRILSRLSLRNVSKTFLVGGSCVGFFSVTSIAYLQKQQWQNPHLWFPCSNRLYSSVSASTSIVNSPFQHAAIRHMVGKPDKSIDGLRLTLFQFQTCPFCCKVRAYLDYRGFAYDVVEVNSVMRQQLGWTEHKKVPQLVIQDAKHSVAEYDVISDSTVIISSLETFLINKHQRLSEIHQFYPTMEIEDDVTNKKKVIHRNCYNVMFQDYKSTRSEEQRDLERKWRRWADETLVHTISPNVYRTPLESFESFEWFSETGHWREVFPWWQERLVVYLGASVMWIVGKKLKKRHNLKDDVRLSLYNECRDWCNALPKKDSFMGGAQPDLSDLAVFGILSSMEGCLAFKEACENVPRLEQWFNEVKKAVNSNAGSSKLAKYDN